MLGDFTEDVRVYCVFASSVFWGRKSDFKAFNFRKIFSIFAMDLFEAKFGICFQVFFCRNLDFKTFFSGKHFFATERVV